MTLLRFSQFEYELYAPEPDGRFDPQAGVGRLLQDVMPGGQGHPPPDLIAYVAAVLNPVPSDEPVVFMVHGFNFNPLDDPSADPGDTDNPHARLFHFGGDDPQAHAISWPRRFGFAENDGGAAGLAIAFGWNADTFPHHLDAYDNGTAASWGLIAVLAAVRHIQPNRRVEIVAHSLGTHVTLHMLRVLASNHHVRALLPGIHRIVLMGGAEFVYHARQTYRMLETIPGASGRALLNHLHIYNFISREDEVVSLISGAFTYGPLGTEKHMIGYHGLQRGERPDNWIDLDLTDDALVQWAQNEFGLGLSGDAPNEWLDHWHFFVHDDNTEFMRRILRGDAATDITSLRGAGIPDGAPQLDQSQTSWAFEVP